MKLFVVGDVHGCYYTMLELLNSWDPTTETLVQIGDLIDRGLHSGKVITHFQELQKSYPSKVICLLGNHEQEFIHYVNDSTRTNWLRFGGDLTLESFEKEGIKLDQAVEWMKTHKIEFVTDHVHCSHAG